MRVRVCVCVCLASDRTPLSLAWHVFPAFVCLYNWPGTYLKIESVFPSCISYLASFSHIFREQSNDWLKRTLSGDFFISSSFSESEAKAQFGLILRAISVASVDHKRDAKGERKERENPRALKLNFSDLNKTEWSGVLHLRCVHSKQCSILSQMEK